jgi:hypothetical protein
MMDISEYLENESDDIEEKIILTGCIGFGSS